MKNFFSTNFGQMLLYLDPDPHFFYADPKHWKALTMRQLYFDLQKVNRIVIYWFKND